MNVLIIGLGSIGRKHITALKEIDPEARLTALRSSAAAEQVEGVENISSLDALNGKPDFVIISNPTHLHARAIRETISLGCPLFIEKPVLSDPAEAPALEQLIREQGIFTYTACNLRFHPVINFLKNYLAPGNERINEVNIYCGSYLPDWRPGKDFRAIYSANESMGGGVHLDLVHEIDYCVWLFGHPVSSRSLRSKRSSLQIDAADFASYQLQYPGFTASITLNYYRRDAKRQVEIVTENDTLTGDLLANRVYSSVSGDPLFEGSFQMAETYTAQLRYFIEHMQQHKQPMNTFSEAAEILKIALHE